MIDAAVKKIQDLKYNEADAQHIAQLCFNTDEELFVKTKAEYVEVRTVKGTLQIQDNGKFWLGIKTSEESYELETSEIPNCWHIVQYLIDSGYVLAPEPIKRYTSLDRFEVAGRGSVFVIESEIERSRQAHDLNGHRVWIDGDIYWVKGVESNCTDKIRKGDKIGLLVKKANFFSLG